MAAHARTVEIPEADRRELQRRARSKGAPAQVVERARIVLLVGDGVPGKQIAARVGCAEPTVVTWRRRYAEFSTDPELAAKIRAVVGLYLHPPTKVGVLCVDE